MTKQPGYVKRSLRKCGEKPGTHPRVPPPPHSQPQLLLLPGSFLQPFPPFSPELPTPPQQQPRPAPVGSRSQGHPKVMSGARKRNAFPVRKGTPCDRSGTCAHSGQGTQGRPSRGQSVIGHPRIQAVPLPGHRVPDSSPNTAGPPTCELGQVTKPRRGSVGGRCHLPTRPLG